MKMKPVYTPEEVAEKLKVGKPTVMRLLNSGDLVGSRIGHKTWRITEEELERFLESKKEKKTPSSLGALDTSE